MSRGRALAGVSAAEGPSGGSRAVWLCSCIPQSLSRAMLCLSASSCLAAVQIRAARRGEAAWRQAEMISEWLLCVLLSSAKRAAAGAF